MYNERSENFSIRDIILQLMFIVLFVFVLIWIFPTRGTIDKKLNNLNLNADLSGIEGQLEVLTNRIFAENIKTMKEAAINYYTDERLPKNVGESKELTLKEMINEKLLIAFKDSKNNSCDLNESYVKITKEENEYLLKINLKCSDDEGYILVHLGCYTYCKTAVCEQKTTTPTNNKPTPTSKDPDPKPTVETKYRYKYVKETKDSYSDWSTWTAWSTVYLASTALREVDTNTYTTSVTNKVLTGYVSKSYQDTSKPIYQDVKVAVGTIDVNTGTCKTWETRIVSTGKYAGEWVFSSTIRTSSVPKNDSVTKYVYNYSATESCGDCISKNITIYDVYTYKIYEIKTTEKYCSKYETTKQTVYGYEKKLIGYETYTVNEPVYNFVTQNITVTQYRYRTRTVIPGTIVYEWANSSSDQNLINKGYKYTGYKELVTY